MFYAKPGAKIALSIGGTVVSSFAGELELKTSQVQLNSAKPVKVSRPIVLSVAADARVLVDLPGVAVGTGRVALRRLRDRADAADQGVDRRSARGRQRADGVAHHARRLGPARTRASSSSGAKRRSCTFSSHHVAPASAYSAQIDSSPARRVAVAGDVEAFAAADRLHLLARARPASSSSLRSRRCSRPSRPSARRGAARASCCRRSRSGRARAPEPFSDRRRAASRGGADRSPRRTRRTPSRCRRDRRRARRGRRSGVRACRAAARRPAAAGAAAA